MRLGPVLNYLTSYISQTMIDFKKAIKDFLSICVSLINRMNFVRDDEVYPFELTLTP